MLLKHDCLKKKKKRAYTGMIHQQRDEACKRSTDIFFLEKKKQKKNTKARTHLYSAAVSKEMTHHNLINKNLFIHLATITKMITFHQKQKGRIFS